MRMSSEGRRVKNLKIQNQTEGCDIGVIDRWPDSTISRTIYFDLLSVYISHIHILTREEQPTTTPHFE